MKDALLPTSLTNDFGSSALRKEPSCHLYKHTAVKWKKHEVFLLILEFSWGTAVQIHSSVALIQPGFLSYQQFTCPVGPKT